MLGVLCASPAAAEDYVPFRPVTSGPFVTFTAPITPRGKLLAQPIASFAFANATLDAMGRPLANGSTEGLRSAALTIFAEYGFDDATAFGAQLAAVHSDRLGASSSGLGELLLFGRRVLFTERAWGLPEATFLLQVKVPTGNAEGVGPLQGTDLRGTGSADLTLGIDLTRGIRPVLVHADLLLTHPLPARIAGVDTHCGDALSWAVSVEWPFWLDRLGVMLELSGRHQLTPTLNGVRSADGHADEIIIGGGAELLFSADLQLLIGYQRTIWGRNIGSFDTLIVTLMPSFF